MVRIATRKRFWVAALFGVLILFYTVRQANFHKFVEHFGDIDPFWAAMVVASAFLSYVCIAGVLKKLLGGISLPISFGSCLKISLLSNTLNSLMSVAGLSGVAAKVYLLSREDIPPSNTLSVSIIHGFLTNTIAVLFIYLGFFYLYSKHQITDLDQVVFGVLILLVAFLLTLVTIQTIIHEGFRTRLWNVGLRIATALCTKIGKPHWIKRERAEAFFQNFTGSLNTIMNNRGVLLAPATLALFDWLFMFLCLKFSFIAIGYPVDNKTVMVGFSVGLFISMFSLTPASIGLMEGSMAWTFYQMGQDYDLALLAILIYRIAYYFIPIGVSLLFLKRFFPDTDLGKQGKGYGKS
ncbi:MAG: lysylphosphatidylglycerol synthase transmembrane domain-containing protein [Syntrophobacteraceae bacterium]|nr:lysylphosphatidylglycerol synthase transmembrane domain-containing protein [Syntrophobacteraceae bacterium]